MSTLAAILDCPATYWIGVVAAFYAVKPSIDRHYYREATRQKKSSRSA